jgi:hypothetical protein
MEIMPGFDWGVCVRLDFGYRNRWGDYDRARDALGSSTRKSFEYRSSSSFPLSRDCSIGSRSPVHLTSRISGNLCV